MKSVKFSELSDDINLTVDVVYESGTMGNAGDDPLHKLLECANMGGFRIRKKENNPDPAFIILYTSKEEHEWPDFLDESTGIFRYYGDNREPGPLDRPKGNQYLNKIFAWAGCPETRYRVPPFLIFEKTGEHRNVRFKGIAVPGRQNSLIEKDLIALWRSKKGIRFQNYESYFSILDVNEVPVSWLKSLVTNKFNSNSNCPNEWKKYIEKGITAVSILQADSVDIPSKKEQLPQDSDSLKLLKKVIEFYGNNHIAFENCAIKIIELLDPNFINFKHTRPSRDGGRDGIGIYKIGGGISGFLKLDCILEAKHYAIDNGVGVKETSRLISRLRAHTFGIFVTTSYIDIQAYRELLEDQHPVLVVTGKDITDILKHSGIDHSNILEFLNSIPDY